MKASNMAINERYNFTNQEERLIYVGYNFSGNGHWHQFEKTSNPGIVWSELQNNDLWMIELTNTKKG